MFVRIKKFPSSKPYSRIKGLAIHPKFPIIAIAICDIKFYLRLHSYSLQPPLLPTSNDLIPEFFGIDAPLFEKTCEMTKKIFWANTGTHLFQITTKGVKVLALESKSSFQKKEYILRNSDYLEDNSEIVCFTGTSKDSHLFYGTLDAKIVRYSLSRKSRSRQVLKSKPIAIQTDPLDKWVCVLSIDNVLSIFSFGGLEYKKEIKLGLNLVNASPGLLTREEFQVHISPDAQTLIIPNVEDTPIGTAFGVNTSNFEVSFLVGFSRAEITCLKYLPYVFQEVHESPQVLELSETDTLNNSTTPLST
jgi:hypothetical protein